ncbi:MAG: AMP-binding protein [Acidobacteriales bacterium]|nr:AMP-binding protein [Terriglobales bacterium]
MLNLDQYASLGAALRAALDRWPREVCLIESDRNQEKARYTYSQFKQAALPLARALQDAGLHAGDRTAIILTNQSKWLLSAYAVMHGGGVLVPLDYKLTAGEHVQLLAHSGAKFLVIEYYLWRALAQHADFGQASGIKAIVIEAPPNADLFGAERWEQFRRDADPVFVPRQRQDVACIVYSSGTGGRPKGCLLTHDNYLEQCKSLTSWYPFWPGVRYLSILPTNHAIDFMVGFIGPFVCGATVVHLRTLRPEFVREAFAKYDITYVSLVPLVLKNLERGIRAKFAELSPAKRFVLQRLIALNKALTRSRPNVALSRKLLPQVHAGFGKELRTIIVGGAFAEPSTLQFFYDLGIPVANGYGLTEAGTALTVNDLRPFRADSVGKPLPGVTLKISDPDPEGVGEVWAQGRTVMQGYLDDPELTSEALHEGWLRTGDLGRVDEHGHLQLSGRKRNMIVTEGGKNIYPEDIESAFASLPVKEYCVFAANYVWKANGLSREMLFLVIRLEPQQHFDEGLKQQIIAADRRLPDFKRVSGYLLWEKDFPRTASMKIKRPVLAEEIANTIARESITPL